MKDFKRHLVAVHLCPVADSISIIRVLSNSLLNWNINCIDLKRRKSEQITCIFLFFFR